MMFAQQENLTRAAITDFARGLGLDADVFEQCLDQSIHRTDVERSIAEGRSNGVSGTPSVFINGRPVNGAGGSEAYERLILDELKAETRDRVRFQ